MAWQDRVRLGLVLRRVDGRPSKGADMTHRVTLIPVAPVHAVVAVSVRIEYIVSGGILGSLS